MRHISKWALLSCVNLTQQIHDHYKERKVNSYELVAAEETSFKMIRSNASLVIKELDELRRTPKKFICLNDDMDPNLAEETQTVRHLLRDYYLSLFPLPSNFELPLDRQNSFRFIWQKETLEASEARKRFSTFCLLLLACSLFILLFCFKASYKGHLKKQAKTFEQRP